MNRASTSRPSGPGADRAPRASTQDRPGLLRVRHQPVHRPAAARPARAGRRAVAGPGGLWGMERPDAGARLWRGVPARHDSGTRSGGAAADRGARRGAPAPAEAGRTRPDSVVGSSLWTRLHRVLLAQLRPAAGVLGPDRDRT